MINHVNATLLQTSPFKSPILGLPFAMGEMRLDGERCTLCHSLTSCSCSVVSLGVTEVGDVRQFEGLACGIHHKIMPKSSAGLPNCTERQYSAMHDG